MFWVHNRELKHLTQGLPIKVQVASFNLVNVSFLRSDVHYYPKFFFLMKLKKKKKVGCFSIRLSFKAQWLIRSDNDFQVIVHIYYLLPISEKCFHCTEELVQLPAELFFLFTICPIMMFSNYPW